MGPHIETHVHDYSIVTPYIFNQLRDDNRGRHVQLTIVFLYLEYIYYISESTVQNFDVPVFGARVDCRQELYLSRTSLFMSQQLHV